MIHSVSPTDLQIMHNELEFYRMDPTRTNLRCGSFHWQATCSIGTPLFVFFSPDENKQLTSENVNMEGVTNVIKLQQQKTGSICKISKFRTFDLSAAYRQTLKKQQAKRTYEFDTEIAIVCWFMFALYLAIPHVVQIKPPRNPQY